MNLAVTLNSAPKGLTVRAQKSVPENVHRVLAHAALAQIKPIALCASQTITAQRDKRIYWCVNLSLVVPLGLLFARTEIPSVSVIVN